MPLFLTEYIAHGRRVVGPLINVETRDQAVAICDYLHAPDGVGVHPRIVGEALTAFAGEKVQLHKDNPTNLYIPAEAT